MAASPSVSSSGAVSDSYECRLREMAADRLHDAVQFATNSSRNEGIEQGSSTALLIAMADTLRSCMRDWPYMEDNADAGKNREESLFKLKQTLREARSLDRTSTDNSLIYVVSDALFLMAEQWPVARSSASIHATRTFKRERCTNDGSSDKKPRLTTSSSINSSNPNRPFIHGQIFPSYPEVEEDEDENGGEERSTHTTNHDQHNFEQPLFTGNVIMDTLLANTNPSTSERKMNGYIKTESDGNDIVQDTLMDGNDIWSDQAALATFAASTACGSIDGRKRDRIFRYYCPECGLGCVAKTQLDSHLNVHTGARPFKCPHCEKAYKRKDHMGDHMKKNHPEEFRKAREKKEREKLAALKASLAKSSGEQL